MKAIKIIIVAVALAALGFGIYKMATYKAPDEGWDVDVAFSTGCEKIDSLAKAKIKKAYRKIKDDDFDGLQSCYEQQLSYYTNDMSCRDCMIDIRIMLNSIHRMRFVEMSKMELNKKEWPHYKKIDALCDTCLKVPMANKDKDLLWIRQGCTEYDSILEYNRKVNGQSYSRPKELKSSWNMENTKKLINGRPTAHNPADKTTAYEESEKSKVRAKLFDAHVEYLKAFVNLAKNNTTKQPDPNTWEQWETKVFSELATFTRERQLYDKSSSEVENKAKEVKSGMFDAHVAYLKEYVKSAKKKVTKESTSITIWENWSGKVQGELKKFENNAKSKYGKTEDVVSSEVKKLKAEWYAAHIAYFNVRIQQAEAIIIGNPTQEQYVIVCDPLVHEIEESFEKQARSLYGKSGSDDAKVLKERVLELQDLVEEPKPEEPQTINHEP